MVDINSADTGASIAHERKIAAFRWRTLNAEVVTRRSAFRLPLPRASSRNSSFQSCSVVLAGYFWDLISGFDVELLDDRTAEILAKRLTNFSARAINRDSKRDSRCSDFSDAHRDAFKEEARTEGTRRGFPSPPE